MDEHGAYESDLPVQKSRTIREQKRQIEKLSKSAISQDEFFLEFLERVVSAVEGAGGAVWMVQPGDEIRLGYQVRLGETQLLANEQNFQRHAELLKHIERSDQPLAVAPSSAADEFSRHNPSGCVLLFAPLSLQGTVAGIVEIVQRPETTAAAVQGNLQFLMRMCGHALEFLQVRYFKEVLGRQQLWSQLEQFTRKVHASLDVTLTAYAVANEGACLIGCDRVSVAVAKGRKYRLTAVSGQDRFERRSNHVQGMEKLIEAVGATGEPLWFTGETADLAPQLTAAFEAYVDVAHSRSVAVIPLFEPSDPVKKDDDAPSKAKKPRAIGALVVELINEGRPPAGWRERVQVVAVNAELALAKALEHDGLFLMPLWRALGRVQWVIQARTLPKTLSITAALVAVVLGLVLIAADFELQGRGTLEPELSRDVFARIDGVVNDVRTQHGQVVKEGDVLAVLKNHDLEFQLANLTGKRLQAQASVDGIHASLLGTKLSGEQRSRLTSELQALDKSLDSIVVQEELLKRQAKDLEVRSPLAGQVMTWDVANLLMARPVQKGQVLLSVADPSGPWILEIRMPENRVGHITFAQDETGAALPVSFVLATDPGVERYGMIQEIAERAEVDSEKGNSVLVKVRFRKEDVPKGLLKPGAVAVARIGCGRRSVGYVWLHDLWEWVQREVLFRF